jgi:adenosine deaminase
MPPELPLAELHVHLDGSLRPATLSELAAQNELRPPGDLLFFPGMSLDAALSRFSYTLSLLRQPAAVRRVAAEICEDFAGQGTTTLEIRFAPQLHGADDPAVYVDAALTGINGRAGLNLCVLYGESPEVAERLVDVAGARPGVTGLDLAGGPAPEHEFGMADYSDAFQRAGRLGLGRTVHAGEGRAAREIRIAIERLGADRIGHGTTLLDEPSVVDLVRETEVTIEACVTSNWHVGAITGIEDHPLPRWLAAGVRACVCTDNTLLSGTHAIEEHRRVRSIPGMSDDLLAQAIAWGHRGAFRRRSDQRE